MDIRKLQRAIVDGLEDVKAQDIAVFNTEAMSPLFERVIIASGSSNRQTKALAASVRDTVKERGMQVLRTEGEDNGEWIIVDCGAAVAHIMQPAIREYYHLEEIWGDKPVRMKVAGAAKGLPKASEPPAVERPQAAPSRAGAGAGQGSTGKPASKPAKPAAPRGQASTARAAPKRTAATTPVPKKAAAKAAATQRPAAKKSASARTASARPAAKPPARKGPPRG